jgi:hypothetical protein
MDNSLLIEKIERMRDGFILAIEFAQKDLPHSAANEELTATRIANQIILSLQAEEKRKKQQ